MDNKKPIFLGITQSTKELQKLIAEHPDYQIVIVAGRDAVCDEYDYTFCQKVNFEIGQVLDCYTPYDGEYVFRSEDDLREAIENALCDDESYNLSDDEFWEYARNTSKNHLMLISEQSAPDDFIPIWEKPFTRTLDVNKQNQFKVTEKLFIHKNQYERLNLNDKRTTRYNDID